MKKNLDILLALAAFLCLVNADAASLPKLQQAQNIASDPGYTTGRGGGQRGSAGGRGRPNEDPGRGLDAAPVLGGASSASGGPSSGATNSMNTGGSGSGSPNNAALGITVISCGSRHPGNSANSVPGQNQQAPNNRTNQDIPVAVGGGTGGGGSLGRGLGGSAPAGGVQAGSEVGSGTGANAGDAGRSIHTGDGSNHNRRPNSAINSAASNGSRSTSSGINSFNGEGGGRAGATAGGAAGLRGNRIFEPLRLGTSSSSSGTSSGRPEDSFASSSSTSGLLGSGDGFSTSFGTGSIGFTRDGGLGGPVRSTFMSRSTSFGYPGSGSITGGRIGAVGGGVRAAGKVPGGGISAGRRGLDGTFATSGSSDSITGRGFPTSGFRSGNSGRGRGSRVGLGEERSRRTQNAGLTGSTRGSSAGSAADRACSGARGTAEQGRNLLSERRTSGSGSSVGDALNRTPENGMALAGSSGGSVGFVDSFPDGLGESSTVENSSVALGTPGGHSSGSASSVPRSHVSGSFNGRLRGGAGASGGETSGLQGDGRLGREGFGSGRGVSGSSIGRPGSGLSSSGSNGAAVVRGGFSVSRGTGSSVEGPAGAVGASGGGTSLPAGSQVVRAVQGLLAGGSGINSNSDITGAVESTSGPTSQDNSQLGSPGAGSRTSVGTDGEFGTNGRGGSGGTGVLPASQTESGTVEVPESETGLDGANDGHTGQNTTASRTTNTDESSPLSIPLGNGPLGLNLPRVFHRRTGGPSHDAAVAAAVALGAIAGVAAVGALGAGIAAAVHANGRHSRRRPGGLRRAGRSRGITKPGISRVGRERRSIPESKVPAEILDQIPMNFQRLY